MAVDFSSQATDLNTQIEAPTRLLDPVSRQGEIDALEQIGRGVKAGAATVATIFRNNSENAQSKYLADFSVRLNSLQDAAAQGGISGTEVRTRGRSILSEALANNPNAEDKILQRYSTWLNQSGVDKISTPEVQKFQIEEAQRQAAVNSGFLSLGDVGNAAKEQQALASLENYQRTVRETEQEVKQLNLQSSRIDLTSKQRSELEEQTQKTKTLGLAKIGNAALPYWRTQYENIKNAAAKATTEQEKQQIITQGLMQLDADFAQRQAALSGDVIGMPQAQIDQLWAPQKALLDAYKKELSGEYTTEQFERTAKNAEALAKANVWDGLTDTGRQYLAASQIAGQAGTIFATPLQSELVDMFARQSAAGAGTGSTDGVGANQLNPATERTKPVDLLPSSSGEKKSVGTYFDSLTSLISDQSKGVFNIPGQDQKALDGEITNQMKAVFKSIASYGSSSESATEFQPAIDFLSNPAVGEYLRTHKMPPSVIADVRTVLQSGYTSQVVPALREELTRMAAQKPRTLGAGQALTMEQVEPTFDQGKLQFKLKEGVADTFGARTTLRQFNEGTFSKVFNKMVTATANINGEDPKAVFEEIAPAVFDTPEAVGPDERSAVDDGDINLAELIETPNQDVVQEVLDARDQREGLAAPTPGEIDTANSRGYEPDINNLRPELRDKVSQLQQAFGKRIPVISGYRDRGRNAKAGGAKKSQHIHGNAVDIDVSELGRADRIALIKLAKQQGFKGVGVYANSLHFDLGGERAWGSNYHRDTLPSWAELALKD